MPNELADRCNVIEECYEFLLAYAAQGVPGEGEGMSSQVRTFLSRAAEALSGIAEAYSTTVKNGSLDPQERHRAFGSVLDRDARDSLAAIELVLALPVISSQLIDNLNASIHLRALLTDLFLIDEILKVQRNAGKQVSTG
jgi:hypothetical protein